MTYTNTLKDRIVASQKEKVAQATAQELRESNQKLASYEAGKAWALGEAPINLLENLLRAREAKTNHKGHYLCYPGFNWDRGVESLWRNGITKTFDESFADGAVDAFIEALDRD